MRDFGFERQPIRTSQYEVEHPKVKAPGKRLHRLCSVAQFVDTPQGHLATVLRGSRNPRSQIADGP